MFLTAEELSRGTTAHRRVDRPEFGVDLSKLSRGCYFKDLMYLIHLVSVSKRVPSADLPPRGGPPST